MKNKPLIVLFYSMINLIIKAKILPDNMNNYLNEISVYLVNTYNCRPVNSIVTNFLKNYHDYMLIDRSTYFNPKNLLLWVTNSRRDNVELLDVLITAVNEAEHNIEYILLDPQVKDEQIKVFSDTLNSFIETTKKIVNETN